MTFLRLKKTRRNFLENRKYFFYNLFGDFKISAWLENEKKGVISGNEVPAFSRNLRMKILLFYLKVSTKNKTFRPKFWKLNDAFDMILKMIFRTWIIFIITLLKIVYPHFSHVHFLHFLLCIIFIIMLLNSYS